MITMLKYILLGIGIGIAIAGMLLFIYCAIRLNSASDENNYDT